MLTWESLGKQEPRGASVSHTFSPRIIYILFCLSDKTTSTVQRITFCVISKFVFRGVPVFVPYLVRQVKPEIPDIYNDK